jgi:hypothetical protein
MIAESSLLSQVQMKVSGEQLEAKVTGVVQGVEKRD